MEGGGREGKKGGVNSHYNNISPDDESPAVPGTRTQLSNGRRRRTLSLDTRRLVPLAAMAR